MTVPQRRSGWPGVHLAMGLVVAVAVYLAADRYATTDVAAFLKDRRQALYAALVSVHITMLGFALATLTVVLGYAQSPRFQVLRDSAWFAALFGVFTAALRVLALAFAAALAGLLFDRNDAPLAVLTAFAAGSTVAALARVVHLLSVLEKVVRVGDQRPVEAAGGLSPGARRAGDQSLAVPRPRTHPGTSAARQTLAHEKDGSRCAQVVALGEVLDARSTDPKERGHLGGAAGLTSPQRASRCRPARRAAPGQGSSHDGLSWRGFSRGPGARLGAGPRVPDSGGAGQVVWTGCGVGAAAAQDRAGCFGDGLGDLPDHGGVSPGPAGEVGEGVAAGVQAVRGGHHVRDALGLNLTAPPAGQVGRQVRHVPALEMPELFSAPRS